MTKQEVDESNAKVQREFPSSPSQFEKAIKAMRDHESVARNRQRFQLHYRCVRSMNINASIGTLVIVVDSLHLTREEEKRRIEGQRGQGWVALHTEKYHSSIDRPFTQQSVARFGGNS